jgi:putative sigma-54 modulation protein
MKKYTLSPMHTEPRLILRGVHLWLTAAMIQAITEKAERLFRHEPRILRIRIDVGCDRSRSGRWFTARGRLEMAGPDLTASVTCDDGYTSINLLIGKLDRMLRRRTTMYVRRRTTGDIRTHAVAAVA